MWLSGAIAFEAMHSLHGQLRVTEARTRRLSYDPSPRGRHCSGDRGVDANHCPKTGGGSAREIADMNWRADAPVSGEADSLI